MNNPTFTQQSFIWAIPKSQKNPELINTKNLRTMKIQTLETPHAWYSQTLKPYKNKHENKKPETLEFQ